LEEEIPPDDDVYEDVEIGGSGADDDDPSEVYATVSSEYKAKKRYTSRSLLYLAMLLIKSIDLK
jgi:hypothetical protein